tara:strand:+ start:270 stop:458 length:189 start_codon:yes stop_codon:yes gene_type:complete
MTNPLSEEDKGKIDTALALIEDNKENVLRAKQAGIDVSPQEAELAKAEERLRAMRRSFFPSG